MMYKTGHSLIKSKMAEIGCPLAGEMSGHIFFADHWYGFDDALYAGIRLLGVIGRMDGKLSVVRAALPHVVNTPELRFDCDDRRKFDVIAEVAARLRAAGAKVSEIDGVRVQTEDGWWLLRASNTQAVLVARCEAGSEEGLARLKVALVAQLTASGLAAPDFSGEKCRPLTPWPLTPWPAIRVPAGPPAPAPAASASVTARMRGMWRMSVCTASQSSRTGGGDGGSSRVRPATSPR